MEDILQRILDQLLANNGRVDALREMIQTEVSRIDSRLDALGELIRSCLGRRP